MVKRTTITQISFALFVVFFSGCYSHQGKRYDSTSLIYEAQQACKRNDPVAALTLLNMELDKGESHPNFTIAQRSLKTQKHCTELESILAEEKYL